jgi:uncharacterized protein (TIGR02646 family)
MRYIKKNIPFKKFIDYIEKNVDLNLSKEDLKKLFQKIPSSIKKELKEYILNNEQNYLCIYCEEKINDIDNSHLEHIKPEDKYEKLIFDYNNLVVSCNGDGKCNFNNKGKNSKTTCGHKKDNKELPLNPLEDENISDYFEFKMIEKKLEIQIIPSKLDENKAKDMIKILNLNSNSPNFNLPYRRWFEKEQFEKFIVKYKLDIKDIKQILNKNTPPFVSCIIFFLKQKNINI